MFKLKKLNLVKCETFVKVLLAVSQYFIVIYSMYVIARKTNVAMKECKNLNELIYLYFIQHFF